MATNLTIESPNFEKIEKEAGQFTSDAVALLWAVMNDLRKVERIDFRRAVDMLRPKVLRIDAAASVDNLDLQGCSMIEFIGSSAQNFTGIRAPEESQVVIVSVTGAGTITSKHNVTSEAANRLFNTSGADQALAAGDGTIYAYLNAAWREIKY